MTLRQVIISHIRLKKILNTKQKNWQIKTYKTGEAYKRNCLFQKVLRALKTKIKWDRVTGWTILWSIDVKTWTMKGTGPVRSQWKIQESTRSACWWTIKSSGKKKEKMHGAEGCITQILEGHSRNLSRGKWETIGE